MLLAIALMAVSPPPATHRDSHLRVDARCHITLDRRPVPFARLHRELMRLHRYRPKPDLHFQPDRNASYKCVDRVLTVIKRSEITKIGFIGNEQYTVDDPIANKATQLH